MESEEHSTFLREDEERRRAVLSADENIDSDWGCNTKNQRIIVLQLHALAFRGQKYISEDTTGPSHAVDVNMAVSHGLGQASARCRDWVQVQLQSTGSTELKDGLSDQK